MTESLAEHERVISELDNLLTAARIPNDPEQRKLEALDYSIVGRVDLVIKQRDHERRECERLRAALKYYADPDNYYVDGAAGKLVDDGECDYWQADFGEVARAALATEPAQ